MPYRITLIAENISVTSKEVLYSLKNRDPKPIQRIVLDMSRKGLDALDINTSSLGDAGDMRWLVEVVQEVSDLPLWLDAVDAEVVESGLKACKDPERATFNLVTLGRELEKKISIVKDFGCSMVIAAISEDGIPRDVDEKVRIIELIYSKAVDMGISSDRIWIDPVIIPISIDPDQMKIFKEAVEGILQVLPGLKLTCGVSNVSIGVPKHFRRLINRNFLKTLIDLEVDSAIIDGYDDELISICKEKTLGKQQEVFYGC